MGIEFLKRTSKKKKATWQRKIQQRNRGARTKQYTHINSVERRARQPPPVQYYGSRTTPDSKDSGVWGRPDSIDNSLIPGRMMDYLEISISNPFVSLSYDGKDVLLTIETPHQILFESNSIEYLDQQEYDLNIGSDDYQYRAFWERIMADSNLKIKRQGNVAHINVRYNELVDDGVEGDSTIDHTVLSYAVEPDITQQNVFSSIGQNESSSVHNRSMLLSAIAMQLKGKLHPQPTNYVQPD